MFSIFLKDARSPTTFPLANLYYSFQHKPYSVVGQRGKMLSKHTHVSGASIDWPDAQKAYKYAKFRTEHLAIQFALHGPNMEQHRFSFGFGFMYCSYVAAGFLLFFHRCFKGYLGEFRRFLRLFLGGFADSRGI